uniref:Uncharacterized protein n=1 Tax=Arundo donax TaxID=35708 RepID=A0A0A9FKN7_ARUDO
MPHHLAASRPQP